MEGFEVDGFVVQHWFDVWGRVVTALYEGRAREARTRWSEARPRVVASLLLRTQFTRVHSFALEAITAAAVVASPEARRHERALALAWGRTAVRAMRAEDRGWAWALADAVEACLESAHGERERALTLLSRAAPQLGAHGLGLYEALAQHLLGARDPSAAAASAAWAEREGVVRVDRLARALLPGFS
ncbi:MAG: hypothetical protein OHK0013_49550 [Sandaracinaceae bacterium]